VCLAIVTPTMTGCEYFPAPSPQGYIKHETHFPPPNSLDFHSQLVRMNREQLIDIATRYIQSSNTKPFDKNALLAFVSKDITTPIPYPGIKPDYAGIGSLTEKVHAASPDFNVAIRRTYVDEVESTVIFQVNATGTHKG
jgi:hypothetical protein